MSDAHPDPLSESFRHVSNHAQVTVTGAARAVEAAASRSERQARFQSTQERLAREQTKAQLSVGDEVANATATQDLFDASAERHQRAGVNGALDAATVGDSAMRAAYPHGVSSETSSPGAAGSPSADVSHEQQLTTEPGSAELGG